jgi:hypothetical protein
MTQDEKKYLEEIQTRICPKCIDGDGHGNCLIAHGTECAVNRFFPQILDVVRSVHDTSMEPYEAALRTKICGACINQSPDGRCAIRDDVECSLDRYFPLIVLAIEELDLCEVNAGSETGKR